MARILGNDPNPSSDSAFDARALTVDGVRWTHTAAKFWAALLQEIAADHPNCQALLFESFSGAILTRELLFPEQALQRALDNTPPPHNLRKALREALADLELFGLPGSVRLTLLGNTAGSEVELLQRELPLDCVDADIFAYLTVWLLEWATIPAEKWQNTDLQGICIVRASTERLPQIIRLRFQRAHLSEGLYAWKLHLTLHTLPADDRCLDG